jgi:type VI secretion system protein ImpF
MSGQTLSGTDVPSLELAVRQAIWDFEPRILRDSLSVRAIVDEREMSRTALTFEIEGTLWAQPAPLRLLLQTEVDLETGHAEVREVTG